MSHESFATVIGKLSGWESLMVTEAAPIGEEEEQGEESGESMDFIATMEPSLQHLLIG